MNIKKLESINLSFISIMNSYQKDESETFQNVIDIENEEISSWYCKYKPNDIYLDIFRHFM